MLPLERFIRGLARNNHTFPAHVVAPEREGWAQPHDIIRLPVEYFVRTMEKHKESVPAFSAEIATSGLTHATHEAKRMVLESDPTIMLQADACCRNRDVVRSGVRTKYRCWINERGEFHESVLI